MKLSITVAFSCLVGFVIGSGDRGTYERMFLYSAYLAEELHKPGGFTIAPLCGTIAPNIGSRPDGRCTFLEFLKHVWGPSTAQPNIPGGTGPPTGTIDADLAAKKRWYANQLGSSYIRSGTEVAILGLPENQDGQKFGAYWKPETIHILEGKMVKGGWDQTINIQRVVAGLPTNRYDLTFIRAADAINAARVHLYTESLTGILTAEQAGLFRLSEVAGTTVENLRLEDNERHRTGGSEKPVGNPGVLIPAGKGAIADRLRDTPEFQALTPEERANFAVEYKSSGVLPKNKGKKWEVFDPVATSKRWKPKISTIDEVMTRVQAAYRIEPGVGGRPGPREHYVTIDSIQEANRRVRNWSTGLLGLCTL